MPFDPASLSDAAIRERYIRIERRGAAVAAALRNQFGEKRGDIVFRFSEEPVFNAYADREGSDYVIEIAAPVPLLLILVFERLLSDPRVLPWVAAGEDDDGSRYGAPSSSTRQISLADLAG